MIWNFRFLLNQTSTRDFPSYLSRWWLIFFLVYRKTHFNYPFSCSYFSLKTFPVAASSLCLLMLSLDRYATVKHSRFTHLRQRHYVPSVLAITSWVGSTILCLPFMFAYKANKSDTTLATSSSPTSTSMSFYHQLNSTTTFMKQNDSLINGRKLCISNYGADEWHMVFMVSYVGIAFIFPCLGIIFNHLGEDN